MVIIVGTNRQNMSLVVVVVVVVSEPSDVIMSHRNC